MTRGLSVARRNRVGRTASTRRYLEAAMIPRRSPPVLARRTTRKKASSSNAAAWRGRPKMAHRVAAVGGSRSIGHLSCQQIPVAYFPRVATVTLRALNGVQPICVDRAEHTRRRPELSNAMSSRSVQRLESCGCTSIGSELVNEMIRSISCTARSIPRRHSTARRKRPRPGDGNRKNVLAADRFLDRLDED